ncbi:VanZ family protein [Geochorda subterranea]|uniref:VanZ family protein n=1 Tax=Geochorda subterranea TaxID=3109564 RepID=A0ABZ1BQP5_9FIRM|nr:VanZ family protein [Limnochorda sp. LNt]WRP14901.1 VanZ family protein [Limnochorda sp. LNt]
MSIVPLSDRPGDDALRQRPADAPLQHGETSRAWRALLRWLPATAYMVANWLVSGLPGDRLDRLVAPDWLMHGLAYLVFGVTLEVAWRGRPHAPLLALATAVLYAGVDEWHQSWVPGRSPSLADWTADVIGAAVGVWGASWLQTGRRRGGTGPQRERPSTRRRAGSAGLVALLALLAPGSVQAPGSPSLSDLHTWIDEAERALVTGDAAGALRQLQGMEAAEVPWTPYAAWRHRTLEARARLALGEPERAVEAAREALAVAWEDDRLEARLLLAQALAAAGEPVAAMDALLAAAEDPLLAYRGPLRASVLAQLARVAPQAAADGPEGEARRLGYARALYRSGRWQDGVAVLSATEWRWLTVDAWTELARGLEALGQRGRQAERLRQALEEAERQGLPAPRVAALRLQLAAALQTSDRVAADALLRRVVEEAPGTAAAGEALSRLVRQSLDDGDVSGALQLVDRLGPAARGTTGWQEALAATFAAVCDPQALRAVETGDGPSGVVSLGLARQLLRQLGDAGVRDAWLLYWSARLEPDARAERVRRLLESYPLSYYAALARERWPELASGRSTLPQLEPGHRPPTAFLPPDVEALRAAGRVRDALQELRYRLAAAAEPVASASQGDADLAAWWPTLVRWEEEAGDHRAAMRHAQRLLPSSEAWVWAAVFPRPYEGLVRAAAADAQVDPLLVWAVMREESAFAPEALSSADAHGLMQLLPSTGRWMADRLRLPWQGAESLWDPAVNVRLGSAYLGYLLQRYGDPRVAVAAYHAGPGRVDRWLQGGPPADVELWVERIPIAATRRYVQSVDRSYRIYRALYGTQGTALAPRA